MRYTTIFLSLFLYLSDPVSAGTTTNFSVQENWQSYVAANLNSPFASFTFIAAGPGYESLFDASASFAPSGPMTSYAWDFGDGTTLVTSSPLITHNYYSLGNFTVTLAVNHGEGPYATLSQEVSNRLLPPSDLKGRPQRIKSGKQVDYIHHLSWKASPDPRVIEYVLLRNGREFDSVPGIGPCEFDDHLRTKGRPDSYTVYAVGMDGLQSPALRIRVVCP